MKTESNLAEFTEVYGSKGAVLPTILYLEAQICHALYTTAI
jgi:hypothetical protein